MDAAAICRRAREQAGLSLRELAARADTSHSALAAYEHGRVTPRTDTLARICRAAGYDLDVELLPQDRDRDEQARQLVDLLELADAFPVQRAGPLDAPIFPPRRFAQ